MSISTALLFPRTGDTHIVRRINRNEQKNVNVVIVFIFVLAAGFSLSMPVRIVIRFGTTS
jgi:hypothetical protein